MSPDTAIKVWFERLFWPLFALVCFASVLYAFLAATAGPREHSRESFTILRFVVMLWALLSAVAMSLKYSNGVWLIFLGIAILFNPFRQFYLSRGIWSAIDLAVVVASFWMLSQTCHEIWRMFIARG